MRTVRYAILCSLLTLSFVTFAVLHGAAGVRSIAALSDLAPMSTPTYVYAGVPFVVRDSYATQICVSTHPGRLLPPFVVSADSLYTSAPSGSSPDVQALVPFMVHDHNGTQICVSTRGGQSLPPFIAP